MITNNELYEKYGDNIVFLFKGSEPYVESTEGHAMGVLIEKDGKVLCNECGLFFDSLGLHVRKHKMNISEYKLKHGFNKSAPLISTRLSNVIRENELKNREKYPNKSKIALKALRKGHETMSKRENPLIGSKHNVQKLNRRNACPEQMKERYRMLREKYGEDIGLNMIRIVDSGVEAYARRHFGSWNKFKEHLGLQPDLTSKKIPRSNLIYSLREYVATHKVLPWDSVTKGSYDGFSYSMKPYVSEFGSFKRALQICGIATNNNFLIQPSRDSRKYKYWFLVQ